MVERLSLNCYDCLPYLLVWFVALFITYKNHTGSGLQFLKEVKHMYMHKYEIYLLYLISLKFSSVFINQRALHAYRYVRETRKGEPD